MATKLHALFAILLALTQAGCVGWIEDLRTPDRNPTPRERPGRLLTISGGIDPTLRVTFTAGFITTHPGCERAVGLAVTHPRTATVESGPQPSGSYRVTMALDHFEPGRCGWRIYGLYYTMAKGDVPQGMPASPTPFVWFAEMAMRPFNWFTDSGLETPAPITIGCQERANPPGTRATVWCERVRGGDRATGATTAIVADFREITDPGFGWWNRRR